MTSQSRSRIEYRPSKVRILGDGKKIWRRPRPPKLAPSLRQCLELATRVMEHSASVTEVFRDAAREWNYQKSNWPLVDYRRIFLSTISGHANELYPPSA